MGATLVAHTAAQSTNGTSVSTTAVDTTGSSLLVVAVAGSKATTPTLSDSAGNSWTQALHQQATLLDACTVFYCSNPITSATHTFTPAGSGSWFPAVALLAFSGTPAGATPDINEGGAGGSANGFRFASATPAQNSEIVLAFAALNVGLTLTIDSSYVLVDDITGVSNQAWGLGTAWIQQGAASATSPKWTASGSAAQIAGVLLSFETVVNASLTATAASAQARASTPTLSASTSPPTQAARVTVPPAVPAAAATSAITAPSARARAAASVASPSSTVTSSPPSGRARGRASVPAAACSVSASPTAARALASSTSPGSVVVVSVAPRSAVLRAACRAPSASLLAAAIDARCGLSDSATVPCSLTELVLWPCGAGDTPLTPVALSDAPLN